MTEEIKNEQVESEAEAESTHDAEPVNGKKQDKKQKKLDPAVKKAEERAAAAEEKAAAAEDKYLRLYAEYDNYRRRTQKEKESTYKDATADAVLGLLPVIDNFELAIKYGESEESKKGLMMILNSAKEALAKLGVTEIEAEGKTFDPNFHNAVMHVEDEEKGENEIVMVLQKGYMLKDKVIRFAMVQVAN